jgi:N-acetylmuramoyl-L-alanine amidase
MLIKNNTLWLDDTTPARQYTIPAVNFGPQIIQPRLIVMHYTAGKTPQGTINWFMNPESRVSSHFLIARDGTISQFVPLDHQAWHTGNSTWKDMKQLNRWSIGIELDNIGFVRKGFTLPPELQFTAFDQFSVLRTWETFPHGQTDATVELCRLLVSTYPTITEVVGHSDIAPTDKLDPGPAFPMDNLRKRVFSCSVLPTRDECIDKMLKEHGYNWA